MNTLKRLAVWAMVLCVSLRAWGADITVFNDTSCNLSVTYYWWNTTCPGSSPAFTSNQTLAPGASVGLNQTDFGGYSASFGPAPGHTGTAQCMNYAPGGVIYASASAIDGCVATNAIPSTNCWHASVFNGTGSDKSYIMMANYHTNPAPYGYYQAAPQYNHFVPRGTTYTWDICEVTTNIPNEYRLLIEDPTTGEMLGRYDPERQTKGGSYSSAIHTNANM